MSEEIPEKEFKLDANLDLGKRFQPPLYEEWKAKVEQDLKGASFEKKLLTKTYENITLNPIYTKEDIKDSSFNRSLPGSDSYVRGLNSAGYHSKEWDVNQELNIADTEEFNKAIIEALNNGQNCVNILLDTATKLGYDADYAKTEQVGDSGLSISAINSLKRALKNIDFSSVPMYLNAGYNVVPMLSLLNAYFQAEKFDIKGLNGSISADPLNHLNEIGELPVSFDFIFEMMKVAVEWKKENAPNLKTIEINTQAYSEAGANSVQELAISISTLVFYVNELMEKGLDPTEILNSIQFSFGISTNYFMEIAKFRAAKILLKTIVSEYGVDSNNIDLNIGAKSSGYYHTKLDPYVNLLRTTTQTFSAIIGGVNNITTSTFDEGIRKSDTFSRRIARNTQTILREESHLDQVIDPAGGSYFIESLTEEMATKAWNLFKEIQNDGGILETLKSGKINQSIDEVVQLRNKDINKRKSVIVGSNMFADINENKLEDRDINHSEFQEKRAGYLKKYRLSGTEEKHKLVLDKLNSILSDKSAKVINNITEAYLLGATLGEISKVQESSFKEETKIDRLSYKTASSEFEQLRANADAYKSKNGSLPKIYLANIGSLKEYKGRADFSKGFFEIGGFDVIDPIGVSSNSEAAQNANESGAPIVVICSTDTNYPNIVPELTKELKSKNANIQVILAGYPKDQIEEHKKSGVDDFIYLGADAMKIISSLYSKMGGIE